MSVNGICQTQPPDSVDTSKITKEIIESSGDAKEDYEKNKEWEKKVKRDKVLKDLEGTPDYYPELGKEKKGKFEWEFDKEKKIDGYKNTVNNNIAAYNNWVETNLGIPTGVQNAARVGGTIAALSSGSGALAVVAPWTLPVFLGGAINRAERERIEKITDQDKQGDIQTVDMMTYNNPPGIMEDTPGGGEFTNIDTTSVDSGTSEGWSDSWGGYESNPHGEW
tara:strand:- start:1371 stop:2036 length:666 start_codon:yes stop_codon:yes gene_type:complete